MNFHSQKTLVARCFKAVALTAALTLAACGGKNGSDTGTTKVSKSHAEQFPSTDGRPPELRRDTAYLLIGRLHPERLKDESFVESYLRTYNDTLNVSDRLEDTPKSREKVIEYAADVPTRLSVEIPVTLGSYDVARGGFLLRSDRLRLDRAAKYEESFMGKRLSDAHTKITYQFEAPADLSFVKAEKPAFCEKGNCTAADHSRRGKLALAFDAVSGTSDIYTGLTFIIKPVEQFLLVQEPEDSSDSKWVSIAKAPVVAAPMDWASRLDAAPDASGAYPLGNSDAEFAYRVALARLPSLLETPGFVERFGDYFGCEHYKARNNEFDWPAARTALIEDMKKRAAEASKVDTVYLDFEAQLGQYDAEKQRFALGTQLRNIGYSDLHDGLGRRDCAMANGQSPPSGLADYVSLRFDMRPSLDISDVPAPTETARAIAADDKNPNRGACIRVFYRLADVSLEKDSFSVKVRFLGEPLRYEVRDKECATVLGAESLSR